MLDVIAYKNMPIMITLNKYLIMTTPILQYNTTKKKLKNQINI